MSTITREFTKEQLIARINQVTEINKYRIRRDPDADGLAMDNELLAIALASLEAEVVHQVLIGDTWVDLSKGATDSQKRVGAIVRTLYTAPPAPVSVPTFDEWLEIRGNKPIGWVKDAMRESYDACRAAMLHGAENIESPPGIKPAPSLDSVAKNAESRCGNSQVIQDVWVIVPVDMTPEQMRAVQLKFELGAYAAANLTGAYSLSREFWNVAMAAAQQREVKK